MRKLLACIACFSMCTLLATARGTEKGSVKIEGTWAATGGILEGKKVPDDEVAKEKLVMILKAGKYEITAMGKQVEAGTYKIDFSKMPVAVDMTISKGTGAGKTQLGILKLDGDILTIAMGEAGGKDRPKNFDGAADVGIIIWKRAK